MSVKRLLDCTPSELARYTKAELLDAIAGSEGRVLACETIGLTPPLLVDVTNAEYAASLSADILLLNMFDVQHPVINALPKVPEGETVRELKRLTGRVVGINLEPCDLQAAPKGKLARLLGRDGFSSEDPEFDKRFSVQCGDPAAAQALLSPQVMDQLLHLGKVYLSVKADGRVFAAIQTDEPLFDAGKGRADQMKERFAGQLRDFTDLLDAMRG